MSYDARRLDRVFRPASIAIVGASNDFVKISGRPIKFLLDKEYRGKIYPINPKYREIAGLPCYADLAAVPGRIDLAIIALPAATVLESARECARRDVGGAIVFSSGFAETGERGKALEDELAALSRSSGLPICGPNTLGFINAFDRVMATFSQAGDGRATPGPIGFVTQSGAFGTAIFALARERGLSLGYFINSGNEAGLKFHDILDYVIHDERIRVAAGYIEGLEDGRALLDVASHALALGKPIVLVKVGRSRAGARAALSHTGSLAGSDEVYSAAFRQAGILRAPQEEAMLDLLAALSLCELPRGPNVGLVTQSGGAGVLMADRAEELNLNVPAPSERTAAALREVIPSFGAVGNPVDITAQFIATPELLEQTLRLVLEDPNIDAGVFYLGLMEPFRDVIIEKLREVKAVTEKPLIVAWAAAPPGALQRLLELGICALPSATRAIDAVHGLVEFARARRSHAAAGPHAAVNDGRRSAARATLRRGASGAAVAPAAAAFEALEAYGIRVARWRLAHGTDEAVAAAAELGYPVALKIESANLPHKSDAGGVKLNLRSADAVAQAYTSVVEAARRLVHEDVPAVVVQTMVDDGIEMIAGVHDDRVFGPVVVVGLGGIFVESLADVSLRVAPLSLAHAAEMIGELRAQAVLHGARGGQKRDLDALARALVALSDLALDCAGELREIDVNPLMLLPQGRGVVAVDALFALHPARSGKRGSAP